MTSDTLATFTNDQLTRARANDFVRVLMLAHQLGDSIGTAVDRFLDYHPRTLNRDVFVKASINPGSTLEPAWAAPLASLRPLTDAFLALCRPATLIGKIDATPVPFNVSVPVQTGGMTARWVGQSAPIPVGNMQLTSATLPIAHAAGILVVTQDLLRATDPAAVTLLRTELIRGMAQYLDGQLVDPTVAAVSGISPASITNTAAGIGSAGTSAAHVLTDLKALIAAFTAMNPDTTGMTILMSPAMAIAVAVATGSQTLGANGGLLYGGVVHTSTALGSRVVVLDPSAIFLADDGGFDVSMSEEATVELDTAATSPQTAAAAVVAFWQAGLVGFKVTRSINWKVARPGAVVYSTVAYL